ncbi:polysaccharide biosynthesis protein, partial [Georgenia sp. 10Sc9-8]|nr:polysaccharide biosynthesis protein [Georgenia halotolerans]
VEIVFTGLRPNEKMHEELFSVEERGERLLHSLISHVRVPALEPGLVRPSSNGSLERSLR